jgi:hypothetical protein
LSRYLYIKCDCGTPLADHVSTRFELRFLKDGLGIRKRLGIGDPPIPSFPSGPSEPVDEEFPVDAAAFSAWHEDAMHRLRVTEPNLPVLHRMWLRSPKGGAQSTSAPFQWKERSFVAHAKDEPEIKVDEHDPKLLIKAFEKLKPFGLRRIPRLELFAPPDWVTRKDGTGVMSASLFDNLFVGTGIELERAPLLVYYERDFRELQKTSDHARDCGRTLKITFV